MTDSFYDTDCRLRTALKESDEWVTPHDLLRSLMDAGLYIATESEWAVLSAVAKISLCDDDPDMDPLDPQEVGEDCYIYTDDQYAIAAVELRRRASR